MDGGRALDLDVPGLGERLLLHLQPEHSNFRQTFKSDRYNISAAAAELVFVQHPPTTTTTHTWWADNEVIL